LKTGSVEWRTVQAHEMRLFTSGIHKGDRKSLNKPKRFGKLIKGAATREGRRPSFFCDAGTFPHRRHNLIFTAAALTL
jgi:hypothetical protein